MEITKLQLPHTRDSAAKEETRTPSETVTKTGWKRDDYEGELPANFIR